VFQASSVSIGAIDPSAPAVTGVSTVTSVDGTTSLSASATASSSDSPSATTSGASASTTVSEEHLEFAKIVVLFVLQESRTVSVAVNAQQNLESFFNQQTQGNATEQVDVGTGNLVLKADFNKFSITRGNGEVIGGDKGSNP